MKGQSKLSKIPTWKHEATNEVKTELKKTGTKTQTSKTGVAVSSFSGNPRLTDVDESIDTKIKGHIVKTNQPLKTYSRKNPYPIKNAEDMKKTKIKGNMAKADQTHAERSSFTCSRCKECFLTRAGFKKHKKRCADAYLCTSLFHPANDEETARGFMVRQMGMPLEPKLICVDCARKFTNMESLLAHRKLHENQIKTDVNQPTGSTIKEETPKEKLNEEKDQAYFTTEVPLPVLHSYLHCHNPHYKK